MKAVSVVLLLLLCGCVISPERDGAKTVYYVSQNRELAGCNNRTTPEERENCYMEVAVSKPSQFLCEEISSKETRNLCYNRLGKKVKNPDICQKIEKDDQLYTDCMTSSMI